MERGVMNRTTYYDRLVHFWIPICIQWNDRKFTPKDKDHTSMTLRKVNNDIL